MWSFGFLLLRDAGLIHGEPDRWVLERSFLDRLHRVSVDHWNKYPQDMVVVDKSGDMPGETFPTRTGHLHRLVSDWTHLREGFT